MEPPPLSPRLSPNASGFAFSLPSSLTPFESARGPAYRATGCLACVRALQGVTTMSWSLSRRRLRKRVGGQAFARPKLECLEPRLAPANVPVLSGHYDGFLSGANTQETVLTPANVNAS